MDAGSARSQTDTALAQTTAAAESGCLSPNDAQRMLASVLANLRAMAYRCRNDEVWTLLFVSEGSLELTGYEPHDLLLNRRLSYGDLIAKADRARVWAEVQTALAEGRSFDLEYRIVKASGDVRWVSERGRAIVGEGGETFLEGVIYDITSLREAEASRDEREHCFSLAFNSARDMMVLARVEPGPVFRVVAVNRQYIQAINAAGFSISNEMMAGKTFEQIRPLFGFDDEQWARLLARYKEVVRLGQPVLFEETAGAPAGRFLGDSSITPLVDAAGVCRFVLYSSADVGERRRVERELRESAEKFAKAFNASPGAMSISEPGGRGFIAVNDNYVRMFGFAREELLGRSLSDLGLWSGDEQRDAFLAAFRGTGSVRDLEVVRRRRDGSIITCLLSAESIELDGKACVIAALYDITERRRAEQSLRESEERFSKAFRATPDAVFITDRSNGRVVDANEGCSRVYGYNREECLGKTTLELGVWENPEDRDRFRAALEAGRGSVRNLEVGGRSRAGAPLRVQVSCETIELGGRPHLVTIARDITERKHAEAARLALEEQLRQTQKLEALGQLAGGIAHDFNNILTGIVAYTELALMDVDQPDEVRRHLGAVRKASDRATDLIRQILTFSRQQPPARRPIRLGGVVGEALNLLRSSIPATIAIADRIDPLAPIVLADKSQIHQVVMNLCTNAAHAMRDRPGRLTVRLERTVVGPGGGGGARDLPAGAYARIGVIDTGHGMDETTLARIFDPFFTTKLPGEGTGLGLAVVHGIVRDHQGTIAVRSRPGEGTCFEIYLPEHAAPVVDAPVAPQEVPRGRGEHVLLVDDEPAIIVASTVLLERLGYRVTSHGDPREAWSAFKATPEAFDAVVTDMTMPHLTGVELAGRINERRPGLPILLMSGFSGTWTAESLQSIGVVRLLAKPMSVEEMAVALQEALSFTGGGSAGQR